METIFVLLLACGVVCVSGDALDACDVTSRDDCIGEKHELQTSLLQVGHLASSSSEKASGTVATTMTTTEMTPIGYVDVGEGYCADSSGESYRALYAKGGSLQDCARAAGRDPESIAFDYAPTWNGRQSECDIRYPCAVTRTSESMPNFDWWDLGRASGEPVGSGRRKNGMLSRCYAKIGEIMPGFHDGGDGLCEDGESRSEFLSLYAKGMSLKDCAKVAAGDDAEGSIAFDYAHAAHGSESECDIRYPSRVEPAELKGFNLFSSLHATGNRDPVGSRRLKNGKRTRCYVKIKGFVDRGDGFCEDSAGAEFPSLWIKGVTLRRCAEAAGSDPASIGFDYAPTVIEVQESECDIRYDAHTYRSDTAEGSQQMTGFTWWAGRGYASGLPAGTGRLKNQKRGRCYVKTEVQHEYRVPRACGE